MSIFVRVLKRVGYRLVTDGSLEVPRLSMTLDSAVVDGHGRFWDLASGGRLYTASTGAAGVAPGTVLTTTPPFTLWNPRGSGVDISVISAIASYTSGTPGDGSIVFGESPNTVQAEPSGGTSLVARNTLIGGAPGKAKAFQSATLAAIPNLLFPLTSVGRTDYGTAERIFLDGLIHLLPGTALSIQEIGAAGTSPLFFFAMTWEEVER
jgi:hypothetical protein